MQLVRYGITLHLMKEKDIELVRQWRNDPSVVSNYEYREYITPEMQKEWFKSVNNIHNIYLIVEYKGEKIGVVNAKNIDWERKTCESGIFITDGKYSNTFIPAIIMIMTMEFGFQLFGLFRGYAHVLRTNEPVKKMIASVGYALCPGQEAVENQLYEIVRDRFREKAKNLIRAMHTVMETDEAMTAIIEKSEFDDEVVRAWEEIARKNAEIMTCEETPEARIYHLS